MAVKAIEVKFTDGSTSIDSYNPDTTNLGSLIKINNGMTSLEKFAGPMKIGLARPMEQSVAIPGVYPHVYRFSDNIDHVFLADIATAAATRRIVMYEFNRETSEFNWKGFITLTYPTATVHTIKGMRMVRSLYTTGTVSGSGTSITGTDTTWSTDRLSVGSRIGFGSTDPNQITTWYQISAIGSNTSITLTSSAGSIASTTSYVIEDLMCLTTTTNATATNGGLFVAKGLRVEDFTIGGTTIPAATTVDNIKAVYWLADASTVTNTIACGCAVDDQTTWIDRNVYVLDATGPKVYIYNFRKALSLTAGKDTTTMVLKTGNQAVTGTISQTNNGRIGTLSHGPGSGEKSLYFVTTTRVYRSELSIITSNSTTWQSDTMVEIPPGGTSTYAASGAMGCIEVAGDIDRLVITSSGTAGARSYVTEYNTISDPFTHIFLNDDKQLDQSIADSGGVAHPSILASLMTPWSEQGVLYLARTGTTAILNNLYSLPIGAHWTYAENNQQLLISKQIDITVASKLYNISVRALSKVGSDTFSLAPEPYRIYYRTSGIEDNSSSWTELDDTGDLSGVIGEKIQFAFAFKILGTTCVPARLFGFCLSYEDFNNDSHYMPSILNSSLDLKIFAYRQMETFALDIPALKIKLYNITTDTLLLEDRTDENLYGLFEYSNDGGSTWLAWDETQNSLGNYIRYTATDLPMGSKIKAIITTA